MKGIIDDFRLDGKTVLVTGGSSGIGFAIAKGLADAGARVCINDISDMKLEQAHERFRECGTEVAVYRFDVSNEKEVDSGLSEIENSMGSIDILINNAGIITRAPILSMPLCDFRKVIEINLIGPLIVSKRVIPGMITKQSGKIINICSMMSEYGRNSVSAYSASKGGLKMLTKNMCCEWAKYNIQVNGLGPGYIRTALTEEFTTATHPFNKLVLSRTPANRWGEIKDLVGTAIFLASPASNFINGQILYVDGGILANFGYVEGENNI